jgi:hypothetical protein
VVAGIEVHPSHHGQSARLDSAKAGRIRGPDAVLQDLRDERTGGDEVASPVQAVLRLLHEVMGRGVV